MSSSWIRDSKYSMSGTLVFFNCSRLYLQHFGDMNKHSPKFLAYLHGIYEKWNPRAKVDINAHWKKTFLRAWLPGEFQPWLKFRSAHRAEMLLWLHAQFHPGRKTQISMRKFTEVWKHSQCACSRSFFGPRWNSVLITWDFFRFLRPFGQAENTGLGFSARAESLAM